MCGAGRVTPPTTHSTVPTSPVCRPAASRTERSRNVVVVLPFVPVTPTTSRRARRLAEERVRRDGHRGARVLHEQLRHVELERALDDERRGAGGDRPLRELVPVGARAGHAEERCAGRDAIGVVGEIGDLDGSAGAGLARREHARQVVEVHGAILGRAAAECPASALLVRRGAQRLSDALVSGASGGTSRYWRSKRAMSRNAGAATTPP